MRAKFLHSLASHHSNYADAVIITQNLKLSKSVTELKRTHTLLLKTPTRPYILHYSLTQLLIRLLQFPCNNLYYARNLFDEIPNCENQFVWTSLIRSHVLNSRFRHSISLYVKMHQSGVFPSGFTFSSVLNACACIPAIFEGKQVHTMVIQMGFLGNKIVKTALLDVYAKCGFLSDAWDIFRTINDKDIVAWTAMICGYTKMGLMHHARRLFDKMEQRNPVTWATMVAGYANCFDMKAAHELYDKMPERNSVSQVAMIAGYGKCGNVAEAREIFNDIGVQDESCWAAMVACYAQNGYAKAAIEMYKKMKEDNMGITEVAMVGAISACSELGDAEMARTLAAHVDEGHCKRTLFVSNALIHMHSKCGNIDKAQEAFGKMREKDVVSYSALITAFADHGKAKEALDLFSKMQDDGVKPNKVTFIGVLDACSHAGLVEEGFKYFELMTKVFRIKPLKQHYTCMVDLLGRAGQVEKAYNLIIGEIDTADAKTWGSLLAACKVHGNVKFGQLAARHLFELEPADTGNFVLLANTYACMGKWGDSEIVRNMMSEREMQKYPGCSWIQGLR